MKKLLKVMAALIAVVVVYTCSVTPHISAEDSKALDLAIEYRMLSKDSIKKAQISWALGQEKTGNSYRDHSNECYERAAKLIEKHPSVRNLYNNWVENHR